MKKKLSFLILIGIIIVAFSMSFAENRYLDWLTGSFCINTQYSDTIDSQYTHCLYCINFDSKVETILNIDSDAVLMKDSRRGGGPLIVSSIKSGYDIKIGRTNSIWRGYSVSSMAVDKLTGKSVMDYGLNGERYTIPSAFEFDSPLAILGFDSEHEYVYLLQYGVSEDGNLEIQMVQQDVFSVRRTEDVILYRFPLSYRFGMWKYAISSNGKIAWFDPEEKLLRISSENGEITYDRKIGAFSGEICWLDENILLYFDGIADIEENELPQVTYTLMQWDTTKNDTQELTTENGRTISFKVTNVLSPYDIAVSPDCRYISCYYADMKDGLHKILFYSLKDGQSYEMSLWPFAKYDENGDFIFRYGIAENGSVLFQPNGSYEVNCAWY